MLCCLIQALYARECKRADQGAARMVPRLRECHILRDSWTKLNVSPAKIMQVTTNLIIKFLSVTASVL